MGMDGFVWWTGVVEDRNDPAKLGRVRVRCLGFHTEDKVDIPTEALPWAHVMQTIHDPSMQGMGTTPPFLVEGTWCIGFFRDAVEKQQPIIIGTLPGYPQLPDDIKSDIIDANTGPDVSPDALQEYRKNNELVGFADPNFKYPQYPNEKSGHTLGESDVNRLARGDGDYIHKVIEEKQTIAENFSEVETAFSSNFEMPVENSVNFSRYPFNHVFESESGHIREYDDTYNEERIQEYHRSGTYYEIDAGGNKVVHVIGDSYEFIAGSNYVNVKGDVNLTIDGNAETLVKEDYNIRCKNLNIEVEEDFNTVVLGDTTQRYEGILKTTVLKAASVRYDDTFDGVFKGNVTQTYGAKVDTSITGAVTERYGETLDRSIVGIHTDIHGAEYNINSTTGGININSNNTISLFSATQTFRASSGITLDAADVNLNSGGSSDLAARKGDTADQGDDPAGISGSDGSNVIETGSATVKIGSADPGISEPSVAASTLSVTVIEDVPVEERVKRQGSDNTEKGGTGGYNPNIDGDYPVVAVPPKRTGEEVVKIIEDNGVDVIEQLSVSEQRQALKDTTDTIEKFYPELADTPEGEEVVNTEDPKSYEYKEELPPTDSDGLFVSTNQNQNQYRHYLGISTAGKTFGDVFDESEITDEIRERNPNKYFPDDYRIVQLRGLPRLKIKNNADVNLEGVKSEILAVAEKTAIDWGKQITINSGLRTPAENRRCGGASSSKHLLGEALDCRMVGTKASERVEFVRLAIKHGAQAFGFYNRFIHIDLGPKRNWGTIPSYYRSTLKAGKISPYLKG